MYVAVSKEISGQYRCAGHFMDGNLVRIVMYTNGHIVVYDHPETNKLYEMNPNLGTFYPRSIGCIRSAQSGTLVVVLGGFYPDVEAGQRFAVIGTEYKIKPPATYQG